MTDALLRKTALLVLLAAQAAGLFALTVSVAPTEGPASPPEGQSSPLRFFVSGCLDALFEAGYVVTDDAADRLDPSAWDAKVPNLALAREGFVDYLILVYVEWGASTFHKSALLPVSISYRILRASDGKVLAAGELPGVPDSEEASQNVERSASLSGRQAAAPFVKLLSTLMGGE